MSEPVEHDGDQLVTSDPQPDVIVSPAQQPAATLDCDAFFGRTVADKFIQGDVDKWCREI